MERVEVVGPTAGMSQTSFKKSDQTWAWQPKDISIDISVASKFQAAFITEHVSVTRAAVLFPSLCLRMNSRNESAKRRAANR